jgi:hypothetical protein
VLLTEVTASGLEEPRADWTAAARRNVEQEIREVLAAREDTLVPYRPPAGDPERMHRQEQLLKLLETVGQTILVHAYDPLFELPTKPKGRLGWTLGDGVRPLGEEYQARYALFVYLRDSYTSAGRVAVIVGAALLGAIALGGEQLGFASLVDLENGQIVWFNRLERMQGDLRTPAAAHEAVGALLREISL